MTRKADNQQAEPTAMVQRLNLFESKQDAILNVLPAHMAQNPGRFLQLCVEVIKRNDLADVTPESVLVALYECARHGLFPSINECYIIPRRLKGVPTACWQLGYKGLVKLALRSPEMAAIEAEVVYENDFFEFERGLTPKLRHVPAALNGRDEPGQRIGVWVMAVLADGHRVPHFTPAAEVHRRRALGDSDDSSMSAWRLAPDMMWRKTAAKDASQFWPLEVEMLSALSVDSAVERGDYDFRTSQLLEGATQSLSAGVGDLGQSRVDRPEIVADSPAEAAPAKKKTTRKKKAKRGKTTEPSQPAPEPTPEPAKAETASEPISPPEPSDDERAELIAEIKGLAENYKATKGEALMDVIWNQFACSPSELEHQGMPILVSMRDTLVQKGASVVPPDESE